MAQSKIELGSDSAFKRFLGAEVGEDGTGASVTVLSMLARLEVDQWDEGSYLAKMQEAPARQGLEALMARLNDISTGNPDRGRIAPRLRDLLPRQPKVEGSATTRASAPFDVPPAGAAIYWIISTFMGFGWIAVLAKATDVLYRAGAEPGSRHLSERPLT